MCVTVMQAALTANVSDLNMEQHKKGCPYCFATKHGISVSDLGLGAVAQWKALAEHERLFGEQRGTKTILCPDCGNEMIVFRYNTAVYGDYDYVIACTECGRRDY